MGLPIAFGLTGGEVSDYKGYLQIMNADGPAPKVLLADKGYDADFIRQDMERRDGIAMIPTKRNRLIQLPVDPDIYALRNMVERCFNKLKCSRRLAARYDKTTASYLGFIHIAAVRIWVRSLSTGPSFAAWSMIIPGCREQGSSPALDSPESNRDF